MNNSFKDYCIRVLGHVQPGSTFLSIKNYKNNFLEVSNFNIVFHANYFNAVKKSKNIIKEVKFNKANLFSKLDFDRAKEEMLESFDMTLSGYNPLYTCHDVYEDVLGSDLKPLSGVKVHKKEGVVHISGLKVKKKVLVPGIYSEVVSEPKTLAKKYLKSLTPLNNWVQFKLEQGRFESLAVEKVKIKGKI